MKDKQTVRSVLLDLHGDLISFDEAEAQLKDLVDANILYNLIRSKCKSHETATAGVKLLVEHLQNL